ncbi:hypothetical protein [Mycolicibacterium holsaticum]|uniref:Uncharacterized protein n=1 Tax=Mycolicibacterium holsaticum TaxID=152142 RepID=A0A1E3R7M8_9MYCO|nr:hypothetical protein [Mycolicibacterium holsaticum]ODQ85834.1 hypothetical protein BHQ17_22070 [Mycolicibacterium holsaticum]
MNVDQVYIATRRQLRGVAESLIAGPQYRMAGTIKLAVRPSGFAGTAIALAVQGRELVWPNGAAPLAGPLGAVAEAAGVLPGPPGDVYDAVDALPPDTVLDIDDGSADVLYRSIYAGGHALKRVLPESHPVLWPEHFDVAVADSEVNYGVSPGDDFHPTPYAYVGPWATVQGAFWNAPFGAVTALDPAHDVDTLTERIAEFFERGRAELRGRP